MTSICPVIVARVSWLLAARDHFRVDPFGVDFCWLPSAFDDSGDLALDCRRAFYGSI